MGWLRVDRIGGVVALDLNEQSPRQAFTGGANGEGDGVQPCVTPIGGP